MEREGRLVCIVCGRIFPRGQGIVLEKSGRTLYFHSKRCAYRFFKLLLDLVDEDCIRKPIDDALKEFSTILEKRREAAKKVI